MQRSRYTHPRFLNKESVPQNMPGGNPKASLWIAWEHTNTIIPGAGNSQAYDRYAYVLNNPINYTDPSGYATCEDMPWECDAEGNWFGPATYEEMLATYGIVTTGEGWTNDELAEVYMAAFLEGSKAVTETGLWETPEEAFRAIHGDLEFEMVDGVCPDPDGCWGWAISAHHIHFFRHYIATRQVEDPENPGEFINVEYERNTNIKKRLVAHELAHTFDIVIGMALGKKPSATLSMSMTEDREGLYPPFGIWQQSREITPGEVFADMFIGYLWDRWDFANFYTEATGRRNFMINYMPIWLSIAGDPR